MRKDLTNSQVDRLNILSNNYALQHIYNELDYKSFLFEGKYRYSKSQLAFYYDVDQRTIERVLEYNKSEIENSGYEILTGVRLRKYKDEYIKFINLMKSKYVPDNNVGNIFYNFENEVDNLNKAPQLGVFTFKGFLNVGMLLSGSERAQYLRSIVLDIVIDVMNEKLGGNSKYINQRSQDFLPSAIKEYNYRKDFTDALDQYITENKFKYAQITDRIYLTVFKENAKEYRQILKLSMKESVRSTLYAEILDLISSLESGFSNFLKRKSSELERKLSLSESHILYKEFEENVEFTLKPIIEKARRAMASRDLAFRDALHNELEDYIVNLTPEDFQKFLGSSTNDLKQQLEDNKEVFIRLKDR